MVFQKREIGLNLHMKTSPFSSFTLLQSCEKIKSAYLSKFIKVMVNLNKKKARQ